MAELLHQTFIVVIYFADTQEMILFELLERVFSVVDFGVIENGIVQPLSDFPVVNR